MVIIEKNFESRIFLWGGTNLPEGVSSGQGSLLSELFGIQPLTKDIVSSDYKPCAIELQSILPA